MHTARTVSRSPRAAPTPRLGSSSGSSSLPIRQNSLSGVLLATDAAGEGIDLQRHCHRLVNFDIPFNPNRLEQRTGRIDRYGQTKAPVVWHLAPPQASLSTVRDYVRDTDLLKRVSNKIARRLVGPSVECGAEICARVEHAVRARGERRNSQVVDDIARREKADLDRVDEIFRRFSANLRESLHVAQEQQHRAESMLFELNDAERRQRERDLREIRSRLDRLDDDANASTRRSCSATPMSRHTPSPERSSSRSPRQT